MNRELNVWYDFGEGRGGDVIDLVAQLCSLKSVSASLGRLREIMGDTPIELRPKRPMSSTVTNAAPAINVTRNVPIRSKSLLAYLQKRGIDSHVARHYLRELHYRVGDKNYFALGFANDGHGFELRNPYFKGTCGHKDITTIPGSHDRVYVFEGFFDFLTAASMFDDRMTGTVLVLNSVAMKDRAIEIIRELKPSTIELYRDNDTSGEKLLDYFKQELPESTIVDRASLYAGFGDLNEWHTRQPTRPPPSR